MIPIPDVDWICPAGGTHWYWNEDDDRPSSACVKCHQYNQTEVIQFINLIEGRASFLHISWDEALLRFLDTLFEDLDHYREDR